MDLDFNGFGFSEKQVSDNWAAEYLARKLNLHKELDILDHPDGSVTKSKLSGSLQIDIDNTADTADTALDLAVDNEAAIKELKSRLTSDEQSAAETKKTADNAEKQSCYALGTAMSNSKNIGALSELETSDKTNLVYAINELKSIDDSLSLEHIRIFGTIDNAQTAADNAQTTAENAQTAAEKAQQTAEKTQTEAERLKYYDDIDITPSDESYFTVNETGETITGLKDEGKTQTELVIPYKINGVEITGIYNSVFKDCISLTSINIPDSVMSIGSSAFQNCTSLISINIPDSVTTIGGGVFADCTSLIDVKISKGLKSIPIATFLRCTSLTSINIPDSVTTIDSLAFQGCTSLTSIIIPNSVTYLHSNVSYTGSFDGCKNLTIYCEQGSYADTYAKEENIPVKYTEVIDGLGGFWGLDLPLIKTITLEESVTSIDILSKAEGIELQEFTVMLFIKYLGDAIEDKSISNCIMCLRTNGGSNYFGYAGSYSFWKDMNTYAAWHTKIYNKKFALTDLYRGRGTVVNSDISYMGSQGLIDATTTQSSAYTSFAFGAVDNLNIFISSSDVSRGAIIPQGSMIFLLGR